jgi:hypothetical protein
MIGSLSLPDQEAFVSSVETNGATLCVRLVCDYHPESDSAAYVVVASEPMNVQEAIKFLEQCKSENIYLYTRQDGEAISLTTESGDALRLEAKSISSTMMPLNAEEFSQALSRVWEWYLSENQALRVAREKIQAAQTILSEVERRVEVKSSRHLEGTTAVLYSQQISLIRRVRDALKI